MNAIYARVSDMKLKEDGQRRQDVMRQVDMLKTYAGKDTLLFIDDGISAFKEDYNSRPEFLRLMREIRANRVQHVWVESLDRWSRRITDGLLTLKEAAEHSCTISSISDGEIDITNSQGWFKAGVSLLLAEWASRDKSDKVKNGMERRMTKSENICVSCGVIHQGRHPLICSCPNCKKKRVGKTVRGTETQKTGA
jgi:DNA invertase Pin-like site-specific DNA recombinase